ncbi:bifunctional hydroxymethylpyrimidine kinase/phosphomethylpyrimidine kinase [Glutamicibacter sp. NPDC087344]|uniref:bifunctional hydroxymethylpyrimidine kinase/phosphomethylpyrimidine kinase n=1 Tax=Glutamicibacter sp. NPDC087344 TaxID=3363994 RepID=UPI00381B2A51
MDQQDKNSVLSRQRWELDSRPVNVIAIGSQVVYGTVGLSASVPVLNSYGLKVAALPTAMLSNLPHYPNVHAADLSGPWLNDALHDLTALGVADEASTVYTGYFATPQQVGAVADWIRELLERRPQLRVIVDPTLGDYDVGAYTDPAVAGVLREQLLPLATGIVPNLFELHHLLGREPDQTPSTEQVAADARLLLAGRCRWIAVTGLKHAANQQAGARGQNLVLTPDSLDVIDFERLESGAKGTGDVMAASIIAGLHQGLGIVESVYRAGIGVRERLVARSLELSSKNNL